MLVNDDATRIGKPNWLVLARSRARFQLRWSQRRSRPRLGARAEMRNAPGDDLRYLDWKVFGRTDKYYLKQYEEETNLLCYLLMDTSESMRYRSPEAPMSKLEYARCVAAALSYLILRQQDSVGLATFDKEIRALVRPGSNPSHMKQLLHVMEESVPERKTATGPIFGTRGRDPKGAVAQLERKVFDRFGLPADLTRLSLPRGVRARGSRRPLRVRPSELEVSALADGDGLLLKCGLPSGAYVSSRSRGWVCERGFKKVAESCEAIQLPTHAHLGFSGNTWRCDRGYEKRDQTCIDAVN